MEEFFKMLEEIKEKLRIDKLVTCKIDTYATIKFNDIRHNFLIYEIVFSDESKILTKSRLKCVYLLSNNKFIIFFTDYSFELYRCDFSEEEISKIKIAQIL